MSLFSYKGVDASGKPCRGFTEADSPKAARVKLAAGGIITESVESAHPPKSVSVRDRAKFYNELGVLLNAGFTLERAFGLLCGESASEKDIGFMLAVRELVRNGVAFSDAVGTVLPSLPQFEHTALKTSEDAGVQGKMLIALAEFMEGENEVSDKIKAAITYPLAVLVLAVGLLSLIVYIVLPRAMNVFSKIGDVLPRSAKLLAVWGPRGMTLLLAAVAVFALIIVWCRSRARSDARFAIRLEKTFAHFPIVSKVLPLLWAQRFAGTMSLLIDSGVAPQSAVAPSGAATGSLWLADAAGTAARGVKDGASLSTAILELKPIAPLVMEWIKVGESSGSLGRMLGEAAARCRRAYESTLTRFLGMLEPALIIAVGIVVLIITASVIGPMLQLAKSGM